jgi:CheY-like chemotaxis protein
MTKFNKLSLLKSFKTDLFSTISSFCNGKDGLEALIRIYPDIILLDINMPVMDGWDFMEEMELLESLQIKHISVYIASSSIEDKNKSKNILQF